MPRTKWIGVLLIVGGVVFSALGSLHAIYTFLDLWNPRRLVPSDPAVTQAMANSSLRLAQGRTDMWHAWVGFNFSHSLGVLLVGVLGVLAGLRGASVPSAIILGLTVIGCLCLVVCLLYWFRSPAIGVAIGTSCFAVAWVLSQI